MRRRSAQDHARAEDDEDIPMADVGFIARPRAEAVVGGDQLNEDGAEFSNATANTVAGCAVAGGEDFSGYEVCRCVGA